MVARRVRSARRSPGTAALVLVGALSGCTSASPAAPPLGNCTPTDATICAAEVPGHGAGTPIPDGATPGKDSGNPAPLEAGSCGMIDGFLASTANGVHPSCVACIAASPCCTGDGVCSMDTACFNIVQCVSGTGCQNASCVDMCESQNPLGATDYVEFAGCVQTNCATQCPFLAPIGDP